MRILILLIRFIFGSLLSNAHTGKIIIPISDSTFVDKISRLLIDKSAYTAYYLDFLVPENIELSNGFSSSNDIDTLNTYILWDQNLIKELF